MRKNIIELRIPASNGRVISKRINKVKMLKELHRRVKKNENGVRQIFKQAGVPLKNENVVALTDVRNLYESSPNHFRAMMDFIYPDIVALEKANATGEATASDATQKEESTFNWQALAGGILQGAGGALSTMGTKNNTNELALLSAKNQAELANQNAQSSKKTLWIVIAVVVVMLIAGIFILKRR